MYAIDGLIRAVGGASGERTLVTQESQPPEDRPVLRLPAASDPSLPSVQEALRYVRKIRLPRVFDPVVWGPEYESNGVIYRIYKPYHNTPRLIRRV
jgi:hypothetical protein